MPRAGSGTPSHGSPGASGIYFPQADNADHGRGDHPKKGEEEKVFVHDALGLVDFSLPTKNYLNYPSQSQEQRDAFTDNDNVQKQVQTWLDENYPDNKNPAAYWN